MPDAKSYILHIPIDMECLEKTNVEDKKVDCLGRLWERGLSVNKHERSLRIDVNAVTRDCGDHCTTL